VRSRAGAGERRTFGGIEDKDTTNKNAEIGSRVFSEHAEAGRGEPSGPPTVERPVGLIATNGAADQGNCASPAPERTTGRRERSTPNKALYPTGAGVTVSAGG
jgi:hypothetical protein